MSTRRRQSMLLGLGILLGASSCQMTMTELKALNPSAATLEVPCHPSQIPDNVQRFAVQRGTGHIVTDENQDELRNVAPLAAVFIEVNPAASSEHARVMASDYGLSCPSLVNVDAPSSESWYVRPSPERAPLNSQFLAMPAQPSTASAATAGSGTTSLPRIAVCARPPGINGNEWHGGPKIDGTKVTNATEHAKEVAKATVIFYLDANAPPESIWNFGKDTPVRCPGKKAPIPYDKWVAAHTGTASQSSGSTNAGTPAAPTPTATGTTPKTGSSPPSSGSSPNGQGPELSVFEKIASNVAITGAFTQGNTSAPLYHPQGNRSGIPGGKNVGGFSFPPLQFGVGALEILISAGMSPKSFVDSILKFAKRGQRTLIKEADAKMMQVADELITNHGQFEMAKGLEEMQTIMPYSLGEKFTAKLGGKFQAHKIFEKQAFEKVLEMDEKAVEEAVKKAPAVILTDAEHTEISNALAAAWRANNPMTKEKLLAIYKVVYKEHPEWLEAIASYFR